MEVTAEISFARLFGKFWCFTRQLFELPAEVPHRWHGNRFSTADGKDGAVSVFRDIAIYPGLRGSLGDDQKPMIVYRNIDHKITCMSRIAFDKVNINIFTPTCKDALTGGE